MSKKVKFIDLFAGIGGFHQAIHNEARCVFASEIDEFARKTYRENFKKKSKNLFINNEKHFNRDILIYRNNPKKIEEIPDFNLLCAGFPCQPFSQAGYKRGFEEDKESRGNMFFVIRDIIKYKKPEAVFLENVRHLINHDNGHTFKIIKDIMEKELNYSFLYKTIKASDYGLPQHRPRVFIVCFRNEKTGNSSFKFPKPVKLNKTMSDIMNGNCNKKIGYTLRVGGARSPINDRRNWDGYIVDGKIRRLTVDEGKEMMGFPAYFKFPVNSSQAMKQLGNSVAVKPVKLTAKKIINYLRDLK